MGIGVVAVCLVLAVVLFIRGWRGRFVGVNWCRACRSDLPQGAVSPACPQCGAPLDGDLAVGFGRRRRRPIAIGLAMLFAWAGLSIAADRMANLLGAVDWQAHKPTPLLMREARGANAGRAYAAIEELLKREDAGELSAVPTDSLVGLVLEKVMATGWRTKQPWIPLVEQAWVEGRLSDEQALDFARHLVLLSYAMQGRREIRQGTFLRFSLFPAAPIRLTDHAIEVSTLPLDVSFAGGPVRAKFEPADRAMLIQPGSTSGGGGRVLIPIVATPGVHTLRSTWQIDVQISGKPQTAVSWIETFSQDITIEPPNSESVEILIDDESSEILRRSMRIDVVGVRGLHPETGADVIVGVFDCQPAPMQVRADFEVRLGEECVQSVDRRTMLLLCVPLQDGEDGKPLRVIMRATPIEISDAPGRTRDERPVWYGPDITIECGPVEWFDSITDERIAETIRKRIWARAIRDLAPRPGAQVDP